MCFLRFFFAVPPTAAQGQEKLHHEFQRRPLRPRLSRAIFSRARQFGVQAKYFHIGQRLEIYSEFSRRDMTGRH
jgi:hypothetical protein